jgi:hypothetical protein
MKTACDDFRETPHYRRDCFREGLRRLGYEVGLPIRQNPGPDDVLLLWNRGPMRDAWAARYEEAGAKVLIAENGYIGKDEAGRQLYALALRQHAGAGEWRIGTANRWDWLGIDCKPWRKDGDQIVVLPQRGIGNPKYAMPKDWPRKVVERLKKITKRPVVVREHPGPARSDPMESMRNAWAAVTWASGAGIKTIVGGVPVFYEGAHWIGGPAAKFGIDDLENPYLGDRSWMLHRLAYAQWTLREIQSGEAFRWLLR